MLCANDNRRSGNPDSVDIGRSLGAYKAASYLKPPLAECECNARQQSATLPTGFVAALGVFSSSALKICASLSAANS
jgi:hypothetical protein